MFVANANNDSSGKNGIILIIQYNVIIQYNYNVIQYKMIQYNTM